VESYVPNPWMILPFGLLLALIALAPLFFADWWAKHYPKVALGLSVVTLGYYLFVLPGGARQTVLHTAEHYISFIALIGSLFVVSGGIHINVKGEATPHVNVIYLFLGAVIANVLGTTGASMLLIRPWIRMNKYRITAFHIVFFIFIVSNVGGCLTPIGDPPLFLGYLLGVPFWWVIEHCWALWLTGVGLLLAMFYAYDRVNYQCAPKKVREALAEPEDQWRFEGLANLFFLGVILASVFISKPVFVREALMLAASVGSYFTTGKQVHQANHFNFHPIQEVAILFVGIFATMIPALDWLQNNAQSFGQPTPTLYYWGTGTLSSLLDNAPTYLSFLTAIFGSIDKDLIAQVQHLVQTGGGDLASITGPHVQEITNTFAALNKYHGMDIATGKVPKEEIEIAYLIGNTALNDLLVAVSVGAVFFGACTYIGNGPNFMVKAIAEHQKVQTPGFLGYILKYTLPIMLPMLLVVWWLFLR
jgi:Na+/H+ antiporter NhaD/arsenite permease-like protein